MVDIIDRAQTLENESRDREISRARAAIEAGPGREFCLNCEEPIPPARRQAMPGCRFCVRCQAEMER